MLHVDAAKPCDDRPERWFPTTPAGIVTAKALCLSCPLILRCLRETLETEQMLGTTLHGIHGGLTPAERTKTSLKRIS